MRALKFIGIGAAVLAALFIAVAAIVAATFDPNAYKPQLVQLVKEKYGRTLAIDGAIGLKFFPRIGASVDGVMLSEPNSTVPFASMGEARVSLALLPLLSKKLIVERIELRDVEANLVKRKDGRTNFDDLTAGKDGPELKKDEPAGTALLIDISGIALRNAAIAWRDETSGTALRLSGVDLTTDRIASGVPGKLSFNGRVQGKQPAINATLKLTGGYRIDFDQPAVQLSRLDLQLQGEAAGWQGLKAALSGDLAWASGNRIDVANLKLDASSADGLDAKISAPRLALSPERSESAPIEGHVRLAKGPRKLDAKIALAAVKSAGQRVDFSRLAVQIDMKQDSLSVQGKLSTPVLLQLDTSQATLPQLAGDFTVSGPDIPNKALQLALGGSAQANWSKKSAQADLSARFDESNAKLKVSVADFARLAPRFDLDVDRINLDRYAADKGAAASPAQKGEKPTIAGAPAKEELIDLSGLKALDAAGNVRVGAIVARGVKAENLRVGVKAAGGRLELNPLAANLYQGSVAGAVSVNANNNQFAVRQQLSNVAVGPLLRDAADKDILEGRGSIGIDVTTSGNTVSALKRGLNGKANLNLRDGAIKGIDLGAIARRVRSLRSGSMESRADSQAEKTDFSELVGSFTIKNGVAHNEDLSVKSPFVRVGGAGKVDVGAGTLDYLVKASIVATATGQEGKAREDVRGLTFPVRLTGPFDNMKYSVDVSALASEAAKEEIRRRVEDQVRERLDDRTKGRIGDALKGLLGR
jgi:AsmA protein